MKERAEGSALRVPLTTPNSSAVARPTTLVAAGGVLVLGTEIEYILEGLTVILLTNYRGNTLIHAFLPCDL